MEPQADEDFVTRLVRRALPMLLLLGSFAGLARLAAKPLTNFDTYFHLRFGEEFRTGHWSLWHPGHVSTLEHAHWVPTQWLTQVVMSQMEHWFGLSGVAWLSGLLFVGYALTLYLSSRRRASLLVVGALMPFALGASASGLSMRPQVISYAACAVTAAAWVRARETGRLPWLLVPMTWVWAMCHGMWPVGVVTGVAAAIGIILDRGPRRMLLVPLACLLAGGLTPVGPRLYGAVLLVDSRGKYFSEWGPPHFTQPQCLMLLVLLAAALVPMLRRGSNSSFDIVMLLVIGGWAVYSQRTVPVAAALVMPFATASLQGLIGPARPADRRERLVALGGAALSLAVLACVVPFTADKPPTEPLWVERALTAMPAGTTVMNDDGWGGYLMWRYPNLNVAYHGYGDVYTDRELELRHKILTLEPGWPEAMASLHAQYALYQPSSSFAYALAGRGWTVVRRSKDVELLKAP